MAKKIPIKYKLVVIEWEDSLRSSPNWADLETERRNAPKCLSVGFLVNDTKKVKTIYPHVGIEDEWTNETGLGGLHIPVKSILSIKEIKMPV